MDYLNKEMNPHGRELERPLYGGWGLDRCPDYQGDTQILPGGLIRGINRSC